MEKNMRKYTLLRTVGRFFFLMFRSLNTCSLTLLYGAIIVGLFLLFYTTKYCAVNDESCYNAVSATVFSLIGFVTFCYLYDFYQIVFKNSVFKISDVLKLSKAKIKSIGFFVVYIMCFVISGYYSWKIIQKPANPDWRIEFGYFTILFILCLIPIMAMRFSAVVAFYFNNQKMPSLSRLYKLTEGRSYIGIVGFLFVLLMLAMLNLHLNNLINLVFASESLSSGILKVYSTILIFLFELGFIMCFFEAQRQLMADEGSDVYDTPFAEVKKEDAPAVMSVAKKSVAEKKTKAKKKQK